MTRVFVIGLYCLSPKPKYCKVNKSNPKQMSNKTHKVWNSRGIEFDEDGKEINK